MELNQADQEMIKDITRLGVRTAVLLRGVMLQKVGRETLEWGLTELAAGDHDGANISNVWSIDRIGCTCSTSCI